MVAKRLRNLRTKLRNGAARNTVRALRGHLILRYFKSKPNWGDAINPILVEHLSGRKVVATSEVFNLTNRPVFSVIGSVLDRSRTSNLVVWGSGFKHQGAEMAVKPRRVCAVRGPRTRAQLLAQGIECPKVYGDPALLFPRVYRPAPMSRARIGLIPHYVDQRHPKIRDWVRSGDVRFIDVLGNVETFVDELASSDLVVSSSLHGLIAADAYGIPSVWASFSDNVEGAGFKFADYFEAVGRPRKRFTVSATTKPSDFEAAASADLIDFDLSPLMLACPFGRHEQARAGLLS